jgi:hypothetical protein
MSDIVCGILTVLLIYMWRYVTRRAIEVKANSSNEKQNIN